MLKCDLHLHSKECSPTVKHTAKELIDKASELNFDVLSFTIRDRVFYPENLVEYAKSKNILLVPGSEITINGKHVLVYGLEDVSMIKTFNDLRKENCLVVAPHPFFKDKTCLGKDLIKNIDLFDGIEYSHFYNHLVNWNKKAVKVAKEFDKPLVGGSDCHLMNLQFNRTYSLVNANKEADSVFEAVRDKKIEVFSNPLKLKEFFEIGFRSRVFHKYD